MKAMRSEKQTRFGRQQLGRRLSRFGRHSYALAVVLAFFPGGLIASQDPWSGGVGAEIILPATFITVGLVLHLGAIRYGTGSAGVWGVLAGLTLVPLLVVAALALSLYVFWMR